jgi:diguanylate cyclase (GGDEF)-like protein
MGIHSIKTLAAHKKILPYLLSLLVIGLLLIIVYFNLEKIIHEQQATAHLINVSGQQRMLSQRSALFTTEFLISDSAQTKQQALTALNTMLTNHDFLLKEHWITLTANQASPLSDAIYALYFSPPQQINRRVGEFSALLKHSLDPLTSLSVIQAVEDQQSDLNVATKQILNSFDILVTQYETENIDRIEHLRTVQKLTLAGFIFAFLVSALGWLRPMINKADNDAGFLHKDASHDYLTHLLTRQSYYVLAKQTVALCRRYESNLSLISFDIDHFKSINDQYGHDMGNMVIKQVADIIQENCRDSDSIFRFGDEEFLLMLPQTSVSEAQRLAEKLRKKIAANPVFFNKVILEVTISGGIAQWHDKEDDLENTLKRADKALFEAKESGRDRTIQAPAWNSE